MATEVDRILLFNWADGNGLLNFVFLVLRGGQDVRAEIWNSQRVFRSKYGRFPEEKQSAFPNIACRCVDGLIENWSLSENVIVSVYRFTDTFSRKPYSPVLG